MRINKNNDKMNKKYIIPDYERKIENVFIVSPINVRNNNNLFDEFFQFIYTLGQISSHFFYLNIICLDNISVKETIKEIKEKLYSNTEKDIFLTKNLIGKAYIIYNIKNISDIWIRDYFSCGNVYYKNKINCLKAIYSPSYNLEKSVIDENVGKELVNEYFDYSKDFIIPFKLDGGNIISNDEYIFTSEKIYTENLDFSKKEINKYFEKNFKQKLIVLPVEKLDVIGHVDGILRFLDNRTILLPLYPQDYKVDNKYINNVKKIIQNKVSSNYSFLYIPNYLSDDINDDNIFSANGIYINFFRFENNIIFPRFNSKDYELELTRMFRNKNVNIYFSPCLNYSYLGGCWNCLTNIKFDRAFVEN